MQAGLRDVLGQDGLGDLARVVWQEQLRIMKEEQKKKKQQQEKEAATDAAQQQQQSVVSAPEVSFRPPEWLKSWRQYYRGQPWGFVAFYLSPAATVGTTPSCGDGDESAQQRQREEFQNAAREIIEAPFNTAVDEGHPLDEVNEARSSFAIKWVEIAAAADEKPDSAAMLNYLRSRYREMRASGDHEQQNLPAGLDQPLFLVANASSVGSVLARATTPGKYWRPDAPFLLAVAAEDELGPEDDANDASEAGASNERSWYKPVFKVAAEVLIGELWPVVDRQITSMGTLTRFVQRAQLVEADDGAGGSLATGLLDEESQIDNDLDDVWWSVHPPPRHMRKRRRI
ncbi:hypothetical protein Micbo1qcDRAFT_169283 [Microdochium bolleyi]|uniref:Uncharacterized protein n=1 Tax=Microdochium bolleyi TaxID=196109 RepID=A0A136IKV4_9PEZI|nr:hypothetical protein Micbo1qcDRAFT_169283 [Microdochium bolleyi]